jgi:hypothetical protein
VSQAIGQTAVNASAVPVLCTYLQKAVAIGGDATARGVAAGIGSAFTLGQQEAVSATLSWLSRSSNTSIQILSEILGGAFASSSSVSSGVTAAVTYVFSTQVVCSGCGLWAGLSGPCWSDLLTRLQNQTEGLTAALSKSFIQAESEGNSQSAAHAIAAAFADGTDSQWFATAISAAVDLAGCQSVAQVISGRCCHSLLLLEHTSALPAADPL